MLTAHKRISVRQVMKPDFHSISGIATAYEALKEMKQHRTSLLVVDKRHPDDESGLLLVSDIARQVLAQDRSPRRVNVYEVMTKPAVCVHPDMDIRYCSRLFARFNLVRALVVEDDTVIGTVSPNALVLDGLFELTD
jgi:CBS domain-containing protein